jgi:uncharacterized tellurite resistance protein B-like protein
MFGELIKQLTGTGSPDPLPPEDCRRALAALLVRIARADDNYTEAEMVRIDRILAARYGLSPFEAAALRAEGEEVEATAPDTVRFTRAIKEAVPFEERAGVVEALWSVALVDGHRDDAENALLRLTANLLGINDRDSALARQRAAGISGR